MDHLKRAVTIFADLGGQTDALDPEVWKLSPGDGVRVRSCR